MQLTATRLGRVVNHRPRATGYEPPKGESAKITTTETKMQLISTRPKRSRTTDYRLRATAHGPRPTGHSPPATGH